jgi:hypothetical protein
MKSRDYSVVVDGDYGNNHRYGFDLYFNTNWNYPMYRWCEEQFGPPYDSTTNPDGVWSRYHQGGCMPNVQVRFEDCAHAIAFKMRFL